MSQFVFKMPDLGEGTVEAEIVAWHARVGDSVREDQVIVEVMTDKAAVEVPAPVGGRVLSVSGSPGDKIAVGAPLIVFELDTEGDTAGGEDRVAAAPGAGACNTVFSAWAVAVRRRSSRVRPSAVRRVRALPGWARVRGRRRGGSWCRRRTGVGPSRPGSLWPT